MTATARRPVAVTLTADEFDLLEAWWLLVRDRFPGSRRTAGAGAAAILRTQIPKLAEVPGVAELVAARRAHRDDEAASVVAAVEARSRFVLVRGGE